MYVSAIAVNLGRRVGYNLWTVLTLDCQLSYHHLAPRSWNSCASSSLSACTQYCSNWGSKRRAHSACSAMPLKLVVDTDVGSDDAIALVMCVAADKQGAAQMLGITCCHGNTGLDNVCINTLKTLHTLNRLDIPVYRGTKKSLVQTCLRPHSIHGTDGFGDFEYPNPPDISIMQKTHAVNYLTCIAAENPGEITLLCLGPLTNVAMAIRMDPEFASNVKHIVIMGGNNEGVGNVTAAAEFNFYCDPEAAHIVIHNMKCPITIFPWETAQKYAKIPYEWRKNVLGVLPTPQTRLVNQVERTMLEAELYGEWHRCDPMAAALTLRPGVVSQRVERHVTVELQGQATRGAMVVDHLGKTGLTPNVTIVERVDVEQYKEMLVEAFCYDMTSAPASKKP